MKKVVGVVIFLIGLIIGITGSWMVHTGCKYRDGVRIRYQRDTIEVKGKADTVRVIKYITGKATLPRPAAETAVRVDTLIRDGKAEIRIFSEDVRTKPIEVSYVLGCEEIRIERVDTATVTVTVPVPRLLEGLGNREIERSWWDEFEWGFATGAVIVLGVAVLVGGG